MIKESDLIPPIHGYHTYMINDVIFNQNMMTTPYEPDIMESYVLLAKKLESV